MRELHPDKYREWQEKLHAWARESGLPPEYVDLGFWRWKAHPNKMINLARERGIPLKPARTGKKMALDVIRGVSPCTAGGYSIEGVLSGGPSVRRGGERNANHRADTRRPDMTRCGSGAQPNCSQAAGVRSSTTGDRRAFEDTVKQVLRASLARCMICVKAAPPGDQVDRAAASVSTGRCDQCGKCTRGCVVARYYDKLTVKTVKARKYIVKSFLFNSLESLKMQCVY
jgi:phosphoadenosine phosphosulfate reductase